MKIAAYQYSELLNDKVPIFNQIAEVGRQVRVDNLENPNPTIDISDINKDLIMVDIKR